MVKYRTGSVRPRLRYTVVVTVFLVTILSAHTSIPTFNLADTIERSSFDAKALIAAEVGEVEVFGDVYVQSAVAEAYGSVLAGIGKVRRPWTNGRIYYSFDPEVSLEIRNLFQRAFREWETDTPLQFIERTVQSNYIYILYGDMAMSAVGMGEGRQVLTTSHNELYRTALHELGHAIGLQHEHQRRDRGDYIEVFPENVVDAYREAITQTVPEVSYTPYDFHSIMHYGRTTLSKNLKDTIRPKEPYLKYLDVIGSVMKVSELDKEGVRLYYAHTPLPVFPVEDSPWPFSDNVTFTWTGIPDALEYELQVAADSTFSQIVYQTLVPSVDADTRFAIEEQSTIWNTVPPWSSFLWRVRARMSDGFKTWSTETVFQTQGPRYVGRPEEEVTLLNYPNPFSSWTTFSFRNPRDGSVKIRIIDVEGKHVATVMDKHLLRGVHRFEWNASDLSSGVYFCQLVSGEQVFTRQIHLVK